MNDEIVVYTVGMKLAAICRVSSKYYFDETKIWEDGIYPHRVKIEPILIPTDPCDIKKLYSVYLGYKGTPDGYFGQAIRPISMNEFSIFQSELARSMNELIKWDGRADKSDFALEVKSYLEKKFSIELIKIRGHLYFQSGTNIHVRGSKKHSDGTGFYYLQQEDYEDAIKNNNSFFAVVLDSVDTTFVIPSIKLKEIFDTSSLVKRHEEKSKWYFDVLKKQQRQILRVHGNSSSKPFEIDDFLNKWEQIPDLTGRIETKVNEDNTNLFVTGYDDENLRISKESLILGWARNSNFLSQGSIVFVFNKTTLFLDSCFIIKSKSNNSKDLIWADEIQSNKVIYPNRWNAELIKDGLDIPLTEINNISPFDKEPFQGLLRGNFPMPVNSPQNKAKYQEFYNFLHSLIQNAVNYWIFIVTDKPSLLAKEIYNTRMNDNFWGLNEGTPNRKNIRKGDKVIFCEGTRQFLGTATIGSDVFQLTDEQKDEVSHGIDFYRASYGVKLTDVVIWEESKDVKNYLESLSFITDKEKYPVYFQGGVKRITNSEYNSITHSTNQKSSTEEVSLWLIRAGDQGQGERIALEKNAIGIGYDGLPGLDLIKEFQAFKEHYRNTHSNESEGRITRVVPQIWNFMYKVKNNDLVILPLKTKPGFVAIGKIISDYKYEDLNEEIKQYRKVEWIRKDVPRKMLDSDIEKSLDAQGTVVYIGDSRASMKVLEMLNNFHNIKPEALIDNGTDKIEEFEDEPLSIPSKEQLDDTFRIIRDKLLIDEGLLRNIVSNLVSGRHILLSGPIGTGKTHLAQMIARYVWNEHGGYYPEIFTANSSWTSVQSLFRPNNLQNYIQPLDYYFDVAQMHHSTS
jgi:predicted RNA-binding protein